MAEVNELSAFYVNWATSLFDLDFRWAFLLSQS